MGEWVGAVSVASVCLIASAHSGPAKDQWRAALERCVEAAGMTPDEYSVEAVEDARCLLAFAPHGEDEVLFRAAYAMGRGLPVLVVIRADEDVARFDPKPQFVEFEMDGPQGFDGVGDRIGQRLAALARSRTAQATRRPVPRPPIVGAGGSVAAAVSSVEQAEALFDDFVADGLSQPVIQGLLLEAGCRASWVKFRLRQHFGGW